MAEVKKFLDSEGLTILCRKFQDYPDNEILGVVINAIDTAKADKISVTSEDNGKVMMVVDGNWAAASVTNAEEVSY